MASDRLLYIDLSSDLFHGEMRWGGVDICYDNLCAFSLPGARKRHTHKPPAHTKQTLAIADSRGHQGLSATSHFSCYPESRLPVHKDSSSSEGLLQVTQLGLPLPKNQEID